MKIFALSLVLLNICCVALDAQTTEEEWKKKAVEDFPDLAVSGSELNIKYVNKVKSIRYSDPSYFKDPRWPYKLVEEVRKNPIIPGLEDVNTEVSTPSQTRRAYINGQQVEIVDVKDIATKAKKGESICLEGVVVKVSQRTLDAKDSFKVELSPNVFCEFQIETFFVKNRSYVSKLGSSYLTEAKLVFENNAVTVHAPIAYNKKRSNLGAIFKPGETVIISGQYAGMQKHGLADGHSITNGVVGTATSSSYIPR